MRQKKLMGMINEKANLIDFCEYPVALNWSYKELSKHLVDIFMILFSQLK